MGDEPIDILINNAGIGSGGLASTSRIDTELWIEQTRVHAIAPILIAQTLQSNLKCGTQRKLVSISRATRSTANNRDGGYAYGASKAALNSCTRGLSRYWYDDGIILGLFDPGWVATDMTAGQSAYISTDEAARGLMSRIAELTLATSGSFQDFRARAYVSELFALKSSAHLACIPTDCTQLGAAR
ncbi:hypothetical protein AOQ73_12465 [Bradyrhizobium pachyrhizi]|nr:hypothetical protein AOQ73_12465 [Bradyrhizobium pachyrhizi]